MRASHIVVEEGVIFWEEGVHLGSVAYSSGKLGIFWEGGRVDSWRVAYRFLERETQYILRGRGRFWECRIIL